MEVKLIETDKEKAKLILEVLEEVYRRLIAAGFEKQQADVLAPLGTALVFLLGPPAYHAIKAAFDAAAARYS